MFISFASSGDGEQHDAKVSNNNSTHGEEDQNHVLDSVSIGWQRDPEKERDKILGFFTLSDQPVPRDIFHLIMSFVPAFPYYFMLRSVCSQWLYEFQEQIYDSVQYLSLVEDGIPKFYMRRRRIVGLDPSCDGDDDRDVDMDGAVAQQEEEELELVQFKPLTSTGKGYRVVVNSKDRRDDGIDRYRYYNRDAIYRFLGDIFPNVKHLKLSWISCAAPFTSSSFLDTLLPRLPRLETVDIVGTKASSASTPFFLSDHINVHDIEHIARCLPSSVKTLNLIGLRLPRFSHDNVFQMFSSAGRSQLVHRGYHFSDEEKKLIEVDIQNLNIIYALAPSTFTSVSGGQLFEDVHQYYEHFSISVVINEHIGTPSNLPAVSRGDYIRYMSNKEGVVLAQMEEEATRPSESNLEALIETCVKEYPYFQPLLAMPRDSTIFQLKAYTQIDLTTFPANNWSLIMTALTYVTSLEHMKYPELVLDVNRVLEKSIYQSTLLHRFVYQCTDEGDLQMLKAFVEAYKPSWTVDGTFNILCLALMLDSTDENRAELIEYILECNSELLFLGDLDGNINKDQKDLPLLQLVLGTPVRLSKQQQLTDLIKQLIDRGISLTNRDVHGNTVVHAACLIQNFEFLRYIMTLCPQETFIATNNKGETPLEKVFNFHLSSSLVVAVMDFLIEVTCLPYFAEGSRALKDYPTSHGTLLHTAIARRVPQSLIDFFLEQGFDPNSRNSNGENVLFFLRPSPGLDTQFRHTPDEEGKQEDYIDETGKMLISAGAQIDVTSNSGGTVAGAAIRNGNYKLLNLCMQNTSSSGREFHELLKPRFDNGFNALHYLFQTIVGRRVGTTNSKKHSVLFTYGSFPIARHCAVLCVKHYPEMLYEKSEPTSDAKLKNISNVSPLQILLRATKGLQIMKDLSIGLSDIANRPVYVNKEQANAAPSTAPPIPVMYLALEVEIDIPLFDKLMAHTQDLLVRDESQPTKPNLLHIAAERDLKLCQCIMKHWKKRYKSKEMSRLVSMPLENDGTAEDRKPRNAALIACESGLYDVFAELWPYTKPLVHQFDDPVDVALKHGHYDFAKSVMLDLDVPTSKDQLHLILRKCLIDSSAMPEEATIARMMETEEQQPVPSWLQILTQAPSTALDGKESPNTRYLSTVQLLVAAGASIIFNWLTSTYQNDPLLYPSLTSVDQRTGNTLLHILANDRQISLKSASSILKTVATLFQMKRTSTSLPGTPVSIKRKRAIVRQVDVDLNTVDMNRLSQFVNIQNRDGQTCVHLVALRSKAPLLGSLLQYGADVNIRDKDNETPMTLMHDRAMTEQVQEFLEKKSGKKVAKKRKAAEEICSDESDSDGDDDNDGDYGSSRRPRTGRKRRKTKKLIQL